MKTQIHLVKIRTLLAKIQTLLLAETRTRLAKIQTRIAYIYIYVCMIKTTINIVLYKAVFLYSVYLYRDLKKKKKKHQLHY